MVDEPRRLDADGAPPRRPSGSVGGAGVHGRRRHDRARRASGSSSARPEPGISALVARRDRADRPNRRPARRPSSRAAADAGADTPRPNGATRARPRRRHDARLRSDRRGAGDARDAAAADPRGRGRSPLRAAFGRASGASARESWSSSRPSRCRPARPAFWGLVDRRSRDLGWLASQLGERRGLGEPSRRVQPGRQIATLSARRACQPVRS